MTIEELRAEYDKIERVARVALDHADMAEQAAREARRRAERLAAYKSKLWGALQNFEPEALP